MDRVATKHIFAFWNPIFKNVVSSEWDKTTHYYQRNSEKNQDKSIYRPIWIVIHKRAFRSYKGFALKVKYYSKNENNYT